jgi:hypothetical protein
MKRLLIYFTPCIIIISACSSDSTIYDSDVILSNRTVNSGITDLRVHIPKGWFFTEAQKDNFIDIWLTRDDYSASIIFLPIYIENTDFNTDNISLDRIFELVKVKAEAEGNAIINPREKLIFNENSLLAFEFTNPEDELLRTVIFPFNGVFYQCRAIIMNSEADPSEIFNIQNSVLKSAFTFN